MTPTQKIDLLRAACCVSAADGDPSEAELAVIGKLVKETGVGRASMDAIMDRAKRDQNFCDEQFKVLNSDPAESMTFLIEVAMSDGQLTDQEIGILRRLSNSLEVPDDVFEKLIVQVKEALG